MTAVAQSTKIGFRETGSSVTVPNNNTARLMFYFDCICSVLEMGNTGEIGRLRDFRNYHRLGSDDIDKLLIFCLMLSPDELNDKCIFHDEAMCGNSSNNFFELSAVKTTLVASESVLIGGERKRVQKIMTYKASWIRNNYIDPMASFQQRLIRIRDSLQSGGSSSRSSRRRRSSGGCVIL